MDSTYVMFVFGTALREPTICLDFVIEVMGIQDKFYSKMTCICYVILKLHIKSPYLYSSNA